MTGKQIAENLRQNKKRWCRYAYHATDRHLNDTYCVIGLKLHELGVAVEKWDHEKKTNLVTVILEELPCSHISKAGIRLLTELQKANDGALTVEEVIRYCESRASVDYPLETLARQLLKGVA
jgi:hypothetical protein